MSGQMDASEVPGAQQRWPAVVAAPGRLLVASLRDGAGGPHPFQMPAEELRTWLAAAIAVKPHRLPRLEDRRPVLQL